MGEVGGDLSCDYRFRIVVHGGNGAGSSSLLNRFCHDSFHPNPSSHGCGDGGVVSAHSYFRLIMLEDAVIRLHVLAGELGRNPGWRHTDGVLVVFDLMDPNARSSLEESLQKVERFAKVDVCTLIVGNKSDLPFDRSALMQLEETFNTQFLLTSAKTSANVDAAFALLTSQLFSRIDRPAPSIKKITNRSAKCWLM